jgi:endonuclease/exonuclease/phosphatase family metal-dependent hydrolase
LGGIIERASFSRLLRNSLLVLSVYSFSFSQGFDTLRIVSYNTLNYPGSTSATRNPEFRKVLNGLKPDLLVVQEMTSAAGMTEFLTNALAPVSSTYVAVPFNDGPDTDNGFFYRNDKWEFISASYIPTALRDIAEYVVRPLNSAEQLRVYSFHLKASQGSANEQDRLAEATILRNHLTNLPPGSNFILSGDYNIYSATEPAWTKLTGSEADNNGRSFDPLNLTGSWSNNASIAIHHTQSPRVRNFGGGATGGMDDRFDIILTSSSMSDNILTATYQAYGNDGLHFNDSINRLPNLAVPDSIANALHAASDHLPVTAKFIFPRTSVPIQLASLRATLNGTRDSAMVAWRTISEVNNFGFEVQNRREGEFETIPNSFVPGNGTTIEPRSYSFAHAAPTQGRWEYRLKQIDLDGTINYTDPVNLEVLTTVVTQTSPAEFYLSQNYPNPFNPSTRIAFSVRSPADKAQGPRFTTLNVYDVLGRQVATLFNDVAEAERLYSIEFHGVDDAGRQLASGMYFYRLVSNTTSSEMKRMMLVK